MRRIAPYLQRALQFKNCKGKLQKYHFLQQVLEEAPPPRTLIHPNLLRGFAVSQQLQGDGVATRMLFNLG